MTEAKCRHISRRTIGGLKSSLRSVKLDRNRVRGVSIGSSRMTDECDVTLLSSFFRDAAEGTFKNRKVHIIIHFFHYQAAQDYLIMKQFLTSNMKKRLYAYQCTLLLKMGGNLPDGRYLRRMVEASVLSSLVSSALSKALMVSGQCEAGEKSGYDCWPSSMVNPSTSTRPYRQVKKHFPRKHRV